MTADLWTRHRTPDWIFTLLNSTEVPLKKLDGVTGGNVEIVTLSTLGGSGNMTITDVGQDINWLTDRVQVTYDPGITGVEPWDVGVYLFSDPKLSRDGRNRYSVGLLPKMTIISEEAFADTYSLAAGSDIVEAVIAVITSCGETRITSTNTGATTSASLSWEGGTSKLSIVNDLLTSANYRALWCDGSGAFRVEPYLEPRERPVARTFEYGEASIHRSNWTRTQSITGVPNQVTVVSPGTDTEPAIIGVAQLTDPNNPFSIPARNGRVINRRVELSDITSRIEAVKVAKRYLTGGLTPTATLEVTHGIVPLEPGARVIFKDGETREATVRRMTFNFTEDSQCASTWTEL